MSRIIPTAAAAALALWAGLALTDATAQSALDDVVVPSTGPSVMFYMQEQRARAKPIDSDTASRIYGGRAAQDGAWPWQVALMAKVPRQEGDTEDKFYQFCGGSIIARQWILTAAHCVMDQDNRQTDAATIFVASGSTKLFYGDFRTVAAVFAHEAYNPVLIDNDVALLKLAEPIGASNGPVGAVAVLPAGSAPPQGAAVVTGWGLIDGDKSTDALMETDIDIVPNATCNRGMAEQLKRDMGSFLLGMGQASQIPMDKLQEAFTILSDNMGDRLSDNMICAGVASGTKTSCKGDSGGPLMVRQADGRWLQVGVVSWGQAPLGATQQCGHPELYAVYTRVSNYFDWINTKIRQN